MKKRFLSILLTLVMVIGMLPTVALAAGPTVTWTNKSFSTTQNLEPNTVLELEGSNVITIGGTVKPDSDQDLYGINGVDGLTIQGNGSLTINIKPTDVVSVDNRYRLDRLKVCGINASNLTIKGNVKIVINIEGAVHDIDGIGANTVSVEDSANLDITVKNTKAHAGCTGIFADTWASLTSTGTTNVNVSVNTTTAYKLGDGILVSGLHNEDANNGDLTIKNGTVNVKFDNNVAVGYGFFGAAIINNTYASDGSLLIENAKVTTTASSRGKQYVAIQECSNTTSTDPTLIVRNSTLDLGGSGLNGGLASWNNGMHLENSKVTVNGGGHTLQARFLKISGGEEVSLKTSTEYPVWVSPTKGYIEFALTSGGKFTAESTKTSTYDMNYVKLGTDNYVTSGSVDYSRHYNDDLNTGFAAAANKKFVVEYQGILSGSAFYTSAVNVGKGVNVNHGGELASIGDRNYQWQISDDGISGWTDISDATENPWTIPADDSYLGKYIRVVVTADGYRGSVVSPAAQITKQNNRHEVPDTPVLDKNTEGTAITIANYQADQEYVVSTSSTPDWANDIESTGNTFEGLATGNTYYVHTRMAETATQQAGMVVRSAKIELTATAETVSLTGIELVAEKYVAASGEYVKITAYPVPSDATNFDGIPANKWYFTNIESKAKLYHNAEGATLNSANSYKSVYLMGTEAEAVEVGAEITISGTPARDTVKIEIAGADGKFAFGTSEISLNPSSITIPQGGTAIVELSSMVTLGKPIDTATWAHGYHTDLNGLTFERIEGTNQFLVKATSDCTVGKGGYEVTVNGTKQTNGLTVNVTGDAIPAESISVSPESLSLKIGETYDLTATVTPANSTDAIAWSVTSGDSYVAVDANGKVAAVSTGTATVTATAGDKSASVTVKVGCATHDWNEWPLTITPKCTDGDLVQTHTCKNCDVTETRVVEAIHFGENYTYDEFDHWMMCAYDCGTVMKDKESHTDTDSNNECDTCGYDMTPAVESTKISQIELTLPVNAGEKLNQAAIITASGANYSVTHINHMYTTAEGLCNDNDATLQHSDYVEIQIDITAAEGYEFADEVSATVNGNDANGIENDKNYNIKLSNTSRRVYYSFNVAAAPGVTDTPVINYNNETYTVSATGNGTVKLYVDGVEVTNPYTFELGAEAVAYEVTATAQEEGKEISATAKQTVIVPPEEVEPPAPEKTATPTISYDEETLTVTATGDGTVKLYVDDVDVANPYTFEKIDAEQTYVITATAQEEGKLISETATKSVTVPAKGAVTPDPDPTYTVTVNGSYADTTGAGEYEEGETVTIHAGSRSGYTFKGWTSSDVTITDANSKTATFEMPASQVTVTATWQKNSTGGGGGGSVATYAIVVEDSDNGEISASKKYASKGTDITLTVKADEGYELDTLKVLDKNGDKVKVTKKGDKYTFEMPASKVTVEATFAKIEVEPTFDDVAEGAYYFDAVEWAVEEGITSGTSATTFSPNATCTRAQAVTFLWRAAGSPEPKSTEMPFEDVAADAYYYDAVLWAVENGITAGTSATTFSPNNDCTRAQIVTFLWRSEKSPAADSVNPFTDVAVEAYYFDAVLWAVENGVTAGTTATTFSPNNDCTRAQIVTFLYRALSK